MSAMKLADDGMKSLRVTMRRDSKEVKEGLPGGDI